MIPGAIRTCSTPSRRKRGQRPSASWTDRKSVPRETSGATLLPANPAPKCPMNMIGRLSGVFGAAGARSSPPRRGGLSSGSGANRDAGQDETRSLLRDEPAAGRGAPARELPKENEGLENGARARDLEPFLARPRDGVVDAVAAAGRLAS